MSNEFLPVSTDELLSMKFDTQESEFNYRRGYLDGFYAAIQSLEVLGRFGKPKIREILEAHWYGELAKWSINDLDKVVLPPGCFTNCAYCGAPAEQIDHIIPRSRGGTDALENLAPACAACNLSKRDRTPEEWTRRNRLILPR